MLLSQIEKKTKSSKERADKNIKRRRGVYAAISQWGVNSSLIWNISNITSANYIKLLKKEAKNLVATPLRYLKITSGIKNIFHE